MGDAGLLLLVMSATFVLSMALVPASRALGPRLGAVDRPGPRKVHRDPTPRTGRLAVFVSFAAVVVMGSILAPHLGESSIFGEQFKAALGLLQEAYRVQGKLAALALGSALAFAVGLADDILGERLHVAAKAGGQLLAAGLLVLGDV